MGIFTGIDDRQYNLDEAQMRKKRSIEIFEGTQCSLHTTSSSD